MSKWWVGLVLGLALTAWPAAAQAQNWYELNLHGGAYRADDVEDTDGLVGARVMLQYGSGWAWGGNFDWVPQNADFGGNDLDFNLYLYSLGLEYMFPSTSALRFFVGSGVGAATTKISDAPDNVDDQTDLLVPVGGGFKWYSGPTTSAGWALRGEIRDNIIFAEEFDAVEGDEDKNATHNFEFSGGVSFLF